MEKRYYRDDTRSKLYRRNLKKITDMCKKLQFQTGFRESTLEEIMQEARIKFWSEFERYYENDAQYLNFLFVVIKNRIRNMQTKTYSHMNRNVTLVASGGQDSDGEIGYVEMWNNVPEVEQEISNTKEISSNFDIQDILEHLEDSLEKEIVIKISSGDRISKISRELDVPKKRIEILLRTKLVDILQHYVFVDDLIKIDNKKIFPCTILN